MRGFKSFLDYVQDVSAEISLLDSVSAVHEFSYVFLTDLLGLPYERDIEFIIDLEPSTHQFLWHLIV